MLVIDDSIPDASASIPLAVEENDGLRSAFDLVSIEAMTSEAVDA